MTLLDRLRLCINFWFYIKALPNSNFITFQYTKKYLQTKFTFAVCAIYCPTVHKHFFCILSTCLKPYQFLVLVAAPTKSSIAKTPWQVRHTLSHKLAKTKDSHSSIYPRSWLYTSTVQLNRRNMKYINKGVISQYNITLNILMNNFSNPESVPMEDNCP